MKKILFMTAIAAGLLFVTGCEKKSPQESIEKVAKDTAAAVKDSADKAEKSVEKSMKCQAGKCASGKCNQGK